LCYRAVLYGVYRYLIFIELSIPLCWGNLWVWSVRERARPRRDEHVSGWTSCCLMCSFMRYLPS